ncbi:hypothetical protein VNO80_04414 [Phaseolus coccineus]|uniref:Uncharacterized protein n=1 Tax=Phaseolus coccineus TaxID=3886 RepID=A0AAN9RRW2_PHACN
MFNQVRINYGDKNKKKGYVQVWRVFNALSLVSMISLFPFSFHLLRVQLLGFAKERPIALYCSAICRPENLHFPLYHMCKVSL